MAEGNGGTVASKSLNDYPTLTASTAADAESNTKVNASGTDLAKTVAKHYNELQEAGKESRTFSRIYHLRNFNNWVKSILIGDTLDKIKNGDRHKRITVLDLCSGKGGDLLKWKKGGIRRLVCADIAATSVEQCQSRYNESVEKSKRDRYGPRLYEAEFITADCTKEILKDKYRDRNIKFDLTSCQFSFHYSFESLPQVETMLRNACECLKPGGYFIGTTPNANEIVKRLRESKDNTFGNDVYRITFPESDKSYFPLFGAKYDFHLEGVVDCPEFLVYFPLLEKLAEKYGMKLVENKPFGEFFNEKIKRGDAVSLIGRMSALEPYPNDEGRSLVGQAPDDYDHAREYLSKLETQESSSRYSRRPQKIGTLSKAEWEAATIYLVFVFQKVEGMEEMPQGEYSRRRHYEESFSGASAEKMTKPSAD